MNNSSTNQPQDLSMTSSLFSIFKLSGERMKEITNEVTSLANASPSAEKFLKEITEKFKDDELIFAMFISGESYGIKVLKQGITSIDPQLWEFIVGVISGKIIPKVVNLNDMDNEDLPNPKFQYIPPIDTKNVN